MNNNEQLCSVQLGHTAINYNLHPVGIQLGSTKQVNLLMFASLNLLTSHEGDVDIQ